MAALRVALVGEELAASLDGVVRYAGGPVRADAIVVTGRVEAEAAGALRAFVAGGGPVLGLGGGFAALCAVGLLPGRLEARAPSSSSPTHARIEGRATPFTWAIPAGRVVRLPATPDAHYVVPDRPALEAAGCVVLRYCDAAGGVAPDSDDVAGVCDAAGRVVGLVPATLGQQLVAALKLLRARNP